MDLLNLSNGAVVLSQSSQFSEDWAALLLLDDTTDKGWATAQGAAFPHEVLIELGALNELTAIVFDNTAAQEASYPGISARGIEVWSSSEGPFASFSKLLDVEAEQGARSAFTFPENTRARWLKLVIRSNWGHNAYTELMELEAYGEPLGSDAPLTALSGVYRTNYGLMLFEQQGTQVHGCYDWDNGTLIGSTRGRVVQFEWREDDGAQIGTAIMVLSHASEALNGLWYEEGIYRGLWIGSRAETGERPACRPHTEGALRRSLRESGRAIVYGIQFDVDSDQLRLESDEVLRDVLAILESQAPLRLVIEGHTDATGEATYNHDLSQRRARAVVDWLIEHGVASERLEAQGYGESQPVARNASNSSGRPHAIEYNSARSSRRFFLSKRTTRGLADRIAPTGWIRGRDGDRLGTTYSLLS